MHIDCQHVFQLRSGIWTLMNMKEKRMMKKESIFPPDESLELHTATLLPAILLSAMIHGTKQSP